MYLNSDEINVLKKVINSITTNGNLREEISILQNKIHENDKRLKEQQKVVKMAIDFSEVLHRGY
ncbi:MAG: hypothetical protein QM295_01870 [Bacillota bacterium]|nr:hypothetical protein [Bacillota bacterium]